ncbi:MAG TPA: YncE family protein, partial [Nitrospirota bacterium]|nr:YncE family protein [Nitrospirota bacterium]
TASDISPIMSSVDVTGLADVTVTITVEVPNGSARSFVVDAYGSQSVLYYSGAATADLTGLPLNLTVNMTYVGALIYVTNSGANTVSVINPATGTVTATIPVGTNPYGIAINSVTSKAYVANFGSSDVSVIDIPTNSVATVALTLATPYGVAVNPSNNRIYITDQWNSPGDVYYINGADNTTGTLLGIMPTYSHGIAVNPNTNIAYIADWGEVLKLDTTTNLPVGLSFAIAGSNESAFGVAIDPSMNITIVTDTGGDLNFIDPADAVTTVTAAGISLEGVALDASTHLAYIADSLADSVLVVDIASQNIITAIPVGATPMGVACYSSAKKLYVANSGDNTVSVIDTNSNTVVNTITVGTNPLGIAVSK